MNDIDSSHSKSFLPKGFKEFFKSRLSEVFGIIIIIITFSIVISIWSFNPNDPIYYFKSSTKDAVNTTEMVNIACSLVKNKNLVKADDNVIITAGVPFGNAGSTNLLRIARIIDDKDLT